MKLIKDDDLPPDNDLPKMFIDAVQMFKSAGYIWIGIDNFVLENDDNAIAAERNDLLRTFNGFTPGRTHHMIALGPSSTSSFGPYYFQSFYSHEEYYQSLDQEKFPIMKGHTTSDDELIRRYVIFGLLCHQEVLFIDVMQKYNVSFVDYFNLELSLMEEKFGKYNVLLINKDKISVNDRGRYVIRSICRVFDRYYHNKNYNIVGP